MDHLQVSDRTLSKEDSDTDGWGDSDTDGWGEDGGGGGGGGGSPVSIRKNFNG